MRQKIRLGELLVLKGLITEEQLQTALVEQKKRGLRLGHTLVELGYIDDQSLLEFLAQQLQIPLVDLAQHSLDAEMILQLPETHARRLRSIILEDRGSSFLIGMADPTDLVAADELARILKRPVERAVVRESDLLRVFDLVYRHTADLTNFAEELRAELADADALEAAAGLSGGDEAIGAPVAKLLNSLFEDAVQLNASDLHIEPDESALRIRQRVDGVLHEQVMAGTRIAPALVQRLKLMSGLDIAEKRIPQDGRFRVSVKGRDIDVRLATMPVQHGESVVMRLLDQSTGIVDLDQLGMPESMVDRVHRILRSPHGMLLVSGPTGSGKTTTLYAALAELNQPERKIVTVEDPVEYRLPRVNQVQVNSRIDLTFARVLRSTLRHDPDVVMVGEIRDEETARIALRASMTGHLVLSTLHTNDAAASVLRLVDMGAPGYLVAASVRAVLAQRLVRRICERCSERHVPSEVEKATLAALESVAGCSIETRRGRGCTYCNDSGYRGRVGVFELLEVDGRMADALRLEDSAAYAEAARGQARYRPLFEGVVEYVRQGTTSLEDAMRVVSELELERPEFRRAAGVRR